MEFRLFIDEFGNGDLDGAVTDPNIRYLALSGIIARQDTHRERIQPALEAMKSEIFGHSPSNPVILHRREIVRRESVFKCLRDPGVQQRFNESMIAIYTYMPYRVITVQIDKKRHYENYGVWRFDPYHYCLHCLLERYINWLRHNKLVGDVVIESRSKTNDKKLKGSYELLYKEGNSNLSRALVQSHLTKSEITMKTKQANIAGLQIADMIVHPSARHMRFERDGIDQPQDFGTKVANILIESKYRRHPVTHRIAGFGTKWLPY